MNLPKRGPGYLDLAQIDEQAPGFGGGHGKGNRALRERGSAHTRPRGGADIAGLRPLLRDVREGAASIEGPKLPETTDVFWNQGYFDAHLEYPIRSERSDFSLDMRLGAGAAGPAQAGRQVPAARRGRARLPASRGRRPRDARSALAPGRVGVREVRLLPHPRRHRPPAVPAVSRDAVPAHQLDPGRA